MSRLDALDLFTSRALLVAHLDRKPCLHRNNIVTYLQIHIQGTGTYLKYTGIQCTSLISFTNFRNSRVIPVDV